MFHMQAQCATRKHFFNECNYFRCISRVRLKNNFILFNFSFQLVWKFFSNWSTKNLFLLSYLSSVGFSSIYHSILQFTDRTSKRLNVKVRRSVAKYFHRTARRSEVSSLKRSFLFRVQWAYTRWESLNGIYEIKSSLQLRSESDIARIRG